MQKNISQNLLFYCFYEWKEGGQNQPPAIKYKGKNHPIKSKVKQNALIKEGFRETEKERDRQHTHIYIYIYPIFGDP